MIDKINASYPEIFLFAVTCLVMLFGLSRQLPIRRLCAPLAGVGLFGAAVIALATTVDGSATQYLAHLPKYGKVLTAVVGLLLLMVMTGVPDRQYESAVARGVEFDPLRATRGEFYSFFLFSLTGLMLCAGADDLILLFLALELTSLPTYVMVTISTNRNRSMEAGVKYFFLGALGAAMFLYGFAMLYGATGSTNLDVIHKTLVQQVATGGLNGIAVAGVLLSVLGICFKIAAVPMHFYTPDVYQGAASPVSAFLAFVPKAAGFFALMLIVGAVGWGVGNHYGPLPDPLYSVLAIIAVLTMTVGNVLALLQRSVKRILAYSSIAHSGYMLVGLITGPGKDGHFSSSGLAAILFYLLTYGVMNLGAFAVIGCLERENADGSTDEADDIADIRGLCRTRPTLGWTMVLSSVGLLGLPPLLGFWAKLPLFTSGIAAGEVVLVVILGLNSAIAAYYYLGMAKAALLESPDPAAQASIRPSALTARVAAAIFSGIGIVVLAGYPLTQLAGHGAAYTKSAVAPTARPAQQQAASADAPAAVQP